jgi:UDP-glucose 4-epimerase
LMIYGDGEQTRDFVNVKDVVDANMLVLSSRKVRGELFNIGTGESITITKLAKTTQEIMGKTDAEIIYAKSRPGDVRHSYADIDKARKTIHYEPKTQLEKGLQELTCLNSKKGGI